MSYVFFVSIISSHVSLFSSMKRWLARIIIFRFFVYCHSLTNLIQSFIQKVITVAGVWLEAERYHRYSPWGCHLQCVLRRCEGSMWPEVLWARHNFNAFTALQVFLWFILGNHWFAMESVLWRGRWRENCLTFIFSFVILGSIGAQGK